MKNNDNNYLQILRNMKVEEKDISKEEKLYLEKEADIEALKARLFILKSLQRDGLIPKNQVIEVEERIKELQGLTVKKDKPKPIEKNLQSNSLAMQQAIEEMAKIDAGTVKYTPKENFGKITELCYAAKPGIENFSELAGYLVWDYSDGNIYIWYPTGNMKTHPNGEWYIPLKVRYNERYADYSVICYGPVKHNIK